MEKYRKVLEIIKCMKIDITKLYILSYITYDNYDKILDTRIIKMLDYIYDTWLEIDDDVCISKLCDIVCDHWEEIINEKYNYDDIISDLFV